MKINASATGITILARDIIRHGIPFRQFFGWVSMHPAKHNINLFY
jgi:hypothetical protein